MTGTGATFKSGAASVVGVATLTAMGSRTISSTASVTGLATPVAFGGLIIYSGRWLDDDPLSPHGIATVTAAAGQDHAGSADILGEASMTTEIETVLSGIGDLRAYGHFGPGEDDFAVPGEVIRGATGSVTGLANAFGAGSRTISSTTSVTGLADTFGLASIVQETTGILFAEADVEGESTQDVETGNALAVGQAEAEGIGSLYFDAEESLFGVADAFGLGEIVTDAAASIVGTAQVGDTVEVVREASAEIFGVASVIGRNIRRPGYARLTVRQDTAELVNA
jgi:hypothetical protein